MDNTTQPVSTYSPTTFGGAPRKSSNKNKIIILVIVVLALLLSTWFFLSRSDSMSEDSAATTTIAPLPTSEVMEEPTEDPEATPADEETTNDTDTESGNEVTVAQDMKIQVQNGSGEEGVASEAQTHLSDAGYTSVETANADNFDYTGVTIQVKAEYKKFLSTLVKDVEEKYTVSEQTSDLDSSSDFDAIVIVGK